MATIQIDILNPKAEKLLRDLADLKLIAIKEPAENAFLATVKKLRKKTDSFDLSMEEITEAVKEVRSIRYAKKAHQNNH